MAYNCITNDGRHWTSYMSGPEQSITPVRRTLLGLGNRYVPAPQGKATHEIHMWLHPELKYYKAYAHPIGR